MTIEQDYLRKIEELDQEITRLRKLRQNMFIDYMHYLTRRKDQQTDLCDYINEQELKDKK